MCLGSDCQHLPGLRAGHPHLPEELETEPLVLGLITNELAQDLLHACDDVLQVVYLPPDLFGRLSWNTHGVVSRLLAVLRDQLEQLLDFRVRPPVCARFLCGVSPSDLEHAADILLHLAHDKRVEIRHRVHFGVARTPCVFKKTQIRRFHSKLWKS